MKGRSSAEIRARAMEYVRSLNDRSIAEFFYEALAEKVRSHLDCERTHWVIANATVVTNDDDSEDFAFSVIALPDVPHYQAEGIDAATAGPMGPCEDGECERCGTPCAS